MGMWALEPWANDGAADWYGDFMDRTKLREAWLKGINEDPNESPDVVRAAGAIFVMLGRVYVWPINNYDKDLELTIAALFRVTKCNAYKGVPELIGLVTEEIEELKSRRKPDSPQTNSSSQSEKKPWWKIW